MGGSTRLDFSCFVCTASTLYSGKTPPCSLVETQCWTPKKHCSSRPTRQSNYLKRTSKCIHFIDCSKSHWLLLWQIVDPEREIQGWIVLGGKKVTSDLNSLFCASSQTLKGDHWRSPQKPCFQKTTKSTLFSLILLFTLLFLPMCRLWFDI